MELYSFNNYNQILFYFLTLYSINSNSFVVHKKIQHWERLNYIQNYYKHSLKQNLRNLVNMKFLDVVFLLQK